PDSILGADFLARYGGITDTFTRIEPDKTYSIRAATEFPIYEHDRVSRFAKLLKSRDVLARLDLLGEMMSESHAGYAACSLTEAGTNRIVELVGEKRDQGLFGARITGGGSGGTVAVLGSVRAKAAIKKIARQYSEETGRETYLFIGSSQGCAAFGHLRLR